MAIIPQKTCTKCGTEQPLTSFYKSKNGKDGHRTDCKDCNCKKAQRWYGKNRDRVLKEHTENKDRFTQNMRAWRAANPERDSANRKRYEKANKERLREVRRAWFNRNKQHVYQRVNQWKKNNPEKWSAYQHKSRRKHYSRVLIGNQLRTARMRGNGGRITYREWKYLCLRYGNQCLCCGQQKRLTIDHIIPVSKGGHSNIDNIQPLCQSCNSSKGDRTIDYRPNIGKLTQERMF